ncbi:MAG: OadG family transporter subunit [Pseudomonadota bacterium]|uniref:OadG family transporter subunit n=1 Tax=Alcanivorax sp. TaxID=1872427 RepID=UPI00243CC30A|nr:OadG family transporter subunit [Alcanivorax sp.]MED5238913.1 OadG family transporter subunit [Pseudomonadota bacterium]MEE3320046.1 OadG family transporter subunit [Pseudomonadota bacterium]
MDSLMSQGLELMLVGMGVVFVFLVVLVGITTLMSALVQRFGQTPVAPAATPAATPAPTASDLPSAAVIKAIEKAVQQHRQSSQS